MITKLNQETFGKLVDLFNRGKDYELEKNLKILFRKISQIILVT